MDRRTLGTPIPLRFASGTPFGRGNLKSDGSKVYTYTQANRLITVTASGLTWNATYNGDGARLTQIANGTPTTYTVDLAAPLVTVLAERTGSTTKQYLYGLGDSPLASYNSATWTYLSGRDGLLQQRASRDGCERQRHHRARL